jgi:CBS domain-containing protein
MPAAVKSRRAPKAEPTAGSIMERRIVSVSSSAPLSEVERLLAEHRISGMPVTDGAGRAIGVVSYHDLLDRYAEDPDARPRRGPAFYRLSSAHMDDEDFESFSVPPESEETAGDVMTPEVISVHRKAGLADVVHTMVERNVHRVLVTDGGDGRLVGIIGSMAVLAAFDGRGRARGKAR